MLRVVFRPLDEYNCTDGINSFKRLGLNAPASSARFPLTTEIGIGTFCIFSILLLDVITTSTSLFSSLSFISNGIFNFSESTIVSV